MSVKEVTVWPSLSVRKSSRSDENDRFRSQSTFCESKLGAQISEPVLTEPRLKISSPRPSENNRGRDNIFFPGKVSNSGKWRRHDIADDRLLLIFFRQRKNFCKKFSDTKTGVTRKVQRLENP